MRQHKQQWSIWLWALSIAGTNAYVIYRRLYEKDRLEKRTKPTFVTYVQFMEKLVLQLIWPEEYYEQQQDNFTSSSQTIATRNSSCTEPVATTFDTDSLLYKRVKSITECTLPTSFPFCFNQKFHHSVPAVLGKPCQWCQYKERMRNPSKDKVILDRRRHRMSGGNLVRVIKRCK